MQAFTEATMLLTRLFISVAETTVLSGTSIFGTFLHSEPRSEASAHFEKPLWEFREQGDAASPVAW